MIFHSLRLKLNREAGRGVAPSKTPLPPRLAIQTVIASEAKQSNYCFQRLLRHFVPRNDNQTASPKEREIKGVRLLHKDQRGFTLIELVIAIAITALITTGITMVIFQVLTGNARSTNHMIAVRQVQNAGYWISRDTQMAQSVDTTDDSGTDEVELVTLTWEEYSIDGDGAVHEVVYTLEDNKLQREHYIDGVLSETAIVAEFIEAANASGKLKLIITATVGTDSLKASETRTYEVTPRPSS